MYRYIKFSTYPTSREYKGYRIVHYPYFDEPDEYEVEVDPNDMNSWQTFSTYDEARQFIEDHLIRN